MAESSKILDEMSEHVEVGGAIRIVESIVAIRTLEEMLCPNPGDNTGDGGMMMRPKK